MLWPRSEPRADFGAGGALVLCTTEISRKRPEAWPRGRSAARRPWPPARSRRPGGRRRSRPGRSRARRGRAHRSVSASKFSGLRQTSARAADSENRSTNASPPGSETVAPTPWARHASASAMPSPPSDRSWTLRAGRAGPPRSARPPGRARPPGSPGRQPAQVVVGDVGPLRPAELVVGRAQQHHAQPLGGEPRPHPLGDVVDARRARRPRASG